MVLGRFSRPRVVLTSDMLKTTKSRILCIALLQVVALHCTYASNEYSTTTETEPDPFISKHESFRNCAKFELDPDEYVLLPNGSAYVPDYNRTYTEKFYHLNEELLLTVCAPMVEEEEGLHGLRSNYLAWLTSIGVGVSMVCLLIHLIVFSLVPDLQNLPGCNMASLCASLFVSYLLMLVINSSSDDLAVNNEGACVALGGMLQFFFIASFLWMFIMAFDVFRSILQATGSLRASTRAFKVKKYLFNSLVAWGTALTFTAAALIVDSVDGVDESFKPNFDDECWFAHKHSLLTFFAGPVFTIIVINFLLFGISAYKIFVNRMKCNQDSQQSNLRKSHMMYFRLAIIMGVAWITGAIAPLFNALWLWYLFAALNTFQGLFIFLAFTCTGKVKKYFKMKLCGDRRISTASSMPTFQSYCYYANSIEKDLDKVVDSKDKSEVIDTVVIHI